MMKTEVEIKLRIDSHDAMRSSLETLGARLVHPREFEDNRLYDFPDRSLQKRGSILRVRTLDRGGLLTYKESPRVEDGAKVRDEIEVTVADGAVLGAILAKLGMDPLFRYQKYRTTYSYGDLIVTIDETPIGSFLELEGPKARIDELATSLGFSATGHIVQSYRDLYFEYLRRRGGTTAGGAEDGMLFPI
jgi:adenylate cyclase class 2